MRPPATLIINRVRQISIHAPRAGCDVVAHSNAWCRQKFQSTHPVRGATCTDRQAIRVARDFNPRTPCGVRHHPHSYTASCREFQSTHPVRGATSNPRTIALFISISIHAPRAGCDDVIYKVAVQKVISIHAPRAGCDQSGVQKRFRAAISIHAPRAGCDCCIRKSCNRRTEFQSTHPVRGATTTRSESTGRWEISIHAPRAGCDGDIGLVMASTQNFNPRTPCGVRRQI